MPENRSLQRRFYTMVLWWAGDVEDALLGCVTAADIAGYEAGEAGPFARVIRCPDVDRASISECFIEIRLQREALAQAAARASNLQLSALEP